MPQGPLCPGVNGFTGKRCQRSAACPRLCLINQTKILVSCYATQAISPSIYFSCTEFTKRLAAAASGDAICYIFQMGIVVKGLTLLLGLVAMSGCTKKLNLISSAEPEAAVVQPAEASRPLQEQWYAERRELYDGIPVTIRFSPASAELAAKVWRYLQQIDDDFNDYRGDSEVARINATPGPTRVKVSAEMAAALKLALDAHGLTQGLFDITIRPLRQVWKQAALKVEKAHRGRDQSSHRCGRKRQAVSVGIRAGHQGSQDLARLRRDHQGDRGGPRGADAQGCWRSGLLGPGGWRDRHFRQLPRLKPHIIGIEDPRQPNREWKQIQGSGEGLCGATSSNAHRAIRIGGQTYYHIFDPRAGRPVPGNALAVSVVFRELGRCWLADALSTACAAMKPERALRLVEELGGPGLDSHRA